VTDLDAGLRLFLLQHPGIAAEVGDRIYPQPLPQGVKLPALTYHDVSDTSSLSSDGPDCVQRPRYQIDHWATTRAEARRVERATRQALHGYAGSWPGGGRVGVVSRINGWTRYEPEEKLFRAIADYRILAW